MASNCKLLKGVATHSLCNSAFRNSLLAQNCLMPGFSTLIYQLITSFKQPAEAKDEGSSTSWLQDYCIGRLHEIYPVKVLPTLRGEGFQEF